MSWRNNVNKLKPSVYKFVTFVEFEKHLYICI